MMTPLLNAIFFSAIVIFIYMNLWFVVSLVLKRNDIADIAWGLGFIVVAWALFFENVLPYSTFKSVQLSGLSKPTNYLVIAILTTLWGLRLAIHIFLRNKDKEEDYRYMEMKKKWGNLFYVNSYFKVFMSQGFLMLLISMSAIVASIYYSSLSVLNYLGIFVWIVGFIFETVGDSQLSKFISDPKNKGKIMTGGLWKYTRHPNYFGEVTQWWGIFLIVLSLPITALAIISPITITFLILKVSGIPLLEEKYENNLEFQKYKKVTSAFFPWFPRKKGDLNE